MKRLIIILTILSILVPDLNAQKRKTQRAYDAYDAGEYYEAIDLFKDAYSKTSKADKATRAELVFMIAEAYRKVNDPRNSETWYKLAVRSSYSKPEAQFWLAESLKKNGKYQQAISETKYKIDPSGLIAGCAAIIESGRMFRF